MKKQGSVDERLFYADDDSVYSYGPDGALRIIVAPKRPPTSTSSNYRGDQDGTTPGGEAPPPSRPRYDHRTVRSLRRHHRTDTPSGGQHATLSGFSNATALEEASVPVATQQRARQPTTPDTDATFGTARDSTNDDVLLTSNVAEESQLCRHLHEDVGSLQQQLHLREERHVAEAPHDENVEPDRRPDVKLSCGSIGCRRVVLLANILAVLSAATVLSVVLIRRFGTTKTTPAVPSPTPMPTTPVTPPPAASTGAPQTTPTPSSTPTPAPTQSLSDLLSSASLDGGEALLTPGTPQNQALDWLAGNTHLASYSDERKKQRYTLATVYYYTDGDDWTNTDNWLDDGDECLRWWQENPPVLNCTVSGAVQELDLESNNLQNNLPPEITILAESLKELDAGDNSLVGQIPTFIGLLTNLVSLHLWENSLTGTIPTEVALLTKLTSLHLRANKLTGTIPSFLNQMTTLENLYLFENDFTGSFECPDFISPCLISCSRDDEPECRSLS